MEVTITYNLDVEEDREMFQRAHPDMELPGTEGSDPEEDGLEFPSEEHRIVYEAIEANPNHALRVYHQALVDDPDTPYDDYDEDDGWNDERLEVRERIHEMRDMGLVDNDGQMWFPTE